MRKYCLVVCFTIVSFHKIEIFSQAKNALSVRGVNDLIDKAKKNLNNNINLADSIANVVYYHSIALNNDSLTAKSYALMAYVSYYKGNYSLSNEYYKKALASKYFHEKLYQRQAMLNNLGVNYEFQHNYVGANQAYSKSLEIARQLKDSLSIYQSHINLGLLNALLNNYSRAREYLSTALLYFERKNDHPNSALCYRNLANLYLLQGKEEECVFNYNRALSTIAKIGDNIATLETNVDFNWALLKFKKYALVKSRQEEFRPLIQESTTPKGIVGTYYMIEGIYLLETKTNLVKAEDAFEKAYQIFKEQKSIRQLTTLQEGRLALYALTGDLEKHRSLLSEYSKMLEETYLSMSANETDALQNIHELDMKRLEVEKLSSKMAAERKINILIVALLGCSLVGFFFMARGYRLIKEQKTKVKQKNIELIALIKLLKDNQLDPEGTLTNIQRTASFQNLDKEEAIAGILDFEKEYNKQVFDTIHQLVSGEKLYLKSDLKIGEVADILRINEKEVSKAINDTRGQRFTSYINEQRINLAKHLLIAKTQHSIKEIAFKTGFSSQPQFQRKFKEITGHTPEQFRQISSY